MSDHDDPAPATDASGFKDRTVGLKFFGLAQIAIGAILGLIATFQVLMSTFVITFLRVAPDELYSTLRLPEAQVESLLAFMPGTSTMALLLCLWGAVLLSFLWYLRRYFGDTESESSV